MQHKPHARLTLQDIVAMDCDSIRELCLQNGFLRIACYAIVEHNATLILDTQKADDDTWPPQLPCSEYYYTAKNRSILTSGWQPVPSSITKSYSALKGSKNYLPVQDLWSNRVLFFVKKDGRTTGNTGELDGFLESLARRFHHWMAGDELRHFIDEATSMEHTHAFSNMMSHLFSHEMRNPVTNLISLSQTQAILCQGTSPEHEDFAREVGRYAQQIWDVIEKLEIATHDNASEFSTSEPIGDLNLYDIIKTCCDAEQKAHEHSPSKLIFSAPDHSIKVRGVKSLITLAVREAVRNAYNYANGTNIRVALYAMGTSSIIDIEDEGVPVAPGQEEMIFLRYFQGQRLPSQRGSIRKGLGLGLFLARFVSRIHNGQMLFVRGIGKKGVFRFILPLTSSSELKKAS